MSTTYTEFQVHVDRLERELEQGNFRPAAGTLATILYNVEFFHWNLGGHMRRLTAATIDDANRLSAAIVRLMTADDYRITYGEVAHLAQFKRTIAQVFEISDHAGTAHLPATIGSRDAGGKIVLSAQQTAKLLLCLSINDMTPGTVSMLLRQPPGLAVPVILGLLSEQVTWSDLARDARSRILEPSGCWQVQGVEPVTVRAMGPAYMGCSYAEVDYKHEIKKYLNTLARQYAMALGCTDVPRPAAGTGGSRPVVVVLAEVYDASHAMHRVFGADIGSLKERFDTVLMTANGKIDHRVEPFFSRLDATPFDSGNPRLFRDAVLAHRPDIVYFPSVGMRFMSILLSNVRLAPVQIVTFGHPATTHSGCIDYAIVHDGVVVDEATLGETIIVREKGVQFLDHAEAVDIAPDIRERPDEVRVAVPAWQRKVTPSFLEVCRRIVAGSTRPVRFAFFPNTKGSAYQAFRRRVERELPARVLPSTTYPEYLSWLNECDLFLSTFPFGATNGIIDAARLGLPIVNMTGREMHSMIDSLMLRELGAPGWLSTDSIESYIAAALRLINDDALRLAVSRGMLGADVRKVFMHKEIGSDFADIFEVVHRRHDAILATGRKRWIYGDLMALE